MWTFSPAHRTRWSRCMLGMAKHVLIQLPLTLHRHVEVDATHHSNLFFWHFANKHIGSKERTVIWLNGGPGCSSMDGAVMEVGPYRLDGENLRLVNGSWNEYANLLFVDQPVGTGFSYADTDSYLHDLDQAADHMVIFLEKYFAIFPEEIANDVSHPSMVVCLY